MIWSGLSGGSGGIAVEHVPCFAHANVAWRRSITSGLLVSGSMRLLSEPV
jgi:hypothetical protein